MGFNSYFIKYDDFLIKEGLIKTYSGEFVIDYLIKNTSLKKEDIWLDDSENATKKIKIEFRKYSYNEAEKTTNMLENLFGWKLSRTQYGMDDEYSSDIVINPPYEELENIFEDDVDNDEFIEFVYEAKFDKKYTDKKDIFYHVTDKKYVDKIMKIGLTPKTKNKLSVHPSRIYLMEDIESIDSLLDNINIDIDNPVILKIDLSDVNMEIYKDPNMPKGVYVLNNIHPNNITVV